MEINVNFSVNNITCKVFEKGNDSSEGYNEELTLNFNSDAAERFLFRFSEPVLIVDGYKLLFRYSNNHMVKAIILYKDNYAYIVTNPNYFINEVTKGYFQLKSLYQLSDILSFDFDTATYLKDVEEVEEEL